MRKWNKGQESLQIRAKKERSYADGETGQKS